MNAILRGVRVIDPLGRLDAAGQDVWMDGGKILAIYHHIDAAGVPVVDLTPAEGAEPCVLCPGFIDLHSHLRQPGEDDAETLESGSRAAAAGGYTHIVAMANTVPPMDTPERVAEARLAASNLPVSILQLAALTRGLEGAELVDIRKCIEAGAIGVGDDGRNAVSPRQLAIALGETSHLSRAVFVHPEDEEMIAQANATQGSVTRSPIRSVETETRAVNLAIRALSHARAGHLHLQHLSAEGSVASLRRARHQGLAVSAEVTPHHLSMWLPVAEEPDPQALRKVNPPLRSGAGPERTRPGAPRRAHRGGGDRPRTPPGGREVARIRRCGTRHDRARDRSRHLHHHRGHGRGVAGHAR